jgi:hypothetical protein
LEKINKEMEKLNLEEEGLVVGSDHGWLDVMTTPWMDTSELTTSRLTEKDVMTTPWMDTSVMTTSLLAEMDEMTTTWMDTSVMTTSRLAEMDEMTTTWMDTCEMTTSRLAEMDIDDSPVADEPMELKSIDVDIHQDNNQQNGCFLTTPQANQPVVCSRRSPVRDLISKFESLKDNSKQLLYDKENIHAHKVSTTSKNVGLNQPKNKKVWTKLNNGLFGWRSPKKIGKSVTKSAALETKINFKNYFSRDKENVGIKAEPEVSHLGK